MNQVALKRHNFRIKVQRLNNAYAPLEGPAVPPAGGLYNVKSVGISETGSLFTAATSSFVCTGGIAEIEVVGTSVGCGSDMIKRCGVWYPCHAHLCPLWTSLSFPSTTMSHNHNHGHCEDEHHDHEHVADSGGNADNLYIYIDQPNVRILNAVEERKILKPWDQRLDEEVVSKRTMSLICTEERSLLSPMQTTSCTSLT